MDEENIQPVSYKKIVSKTTQHNSIQLGSGQTLQIISESVKYEIDGRNSINLSASY